MGFWGVRTTFFCEAIWVVRIIAHQLLNVNPCGCLIWRFGRGNYTTRVNIHLEMTIINLIILDYVSLLGVETIYELQAKWVVLFAAVCRSPKGSQRHIWSNFHSVSRPGWSSKTVVFFLGFSSMEWSLPNQNLVQTTCFFLWNSQKDTQWSQWKTIHWGIAMASLILSPSLDVQCLVQVNDCHHYPSGCSCGGADTIPVAISSLELVNLCIV